MKVRSLVFRGSDIVGPGWFGLVQGGMNRVLVGIVYPGYYIPRLAAKKFGELL
jgi:hypothetical protein